MSESVQAVAYIAAAFVMAIGTLGPAIAQGMIGSKACENVGKYPESYGNIRMMMIMGMAFPETLAVFVTMLAAIILFLSR